MDVDGSVNWCMGGGMAASIGVWVAGYSGARGWYMHGWAICGCMSTRVAERMGGLKLCLPLKAALSLHFYVIFRKKDYDCL